MVKPPRGAEATGILTRLKVGFVAEDAIGICIEMLRILTTHENRRARRAQHRCVR